MGVWNLWTSERGPSFFEVVVIKIFLEVPPTEQEGISEIEKEENQIFQIRMNLSKNIKEFKSRICEGVPSDLVP